jgi:hypothetical protein
LERVTAGSKGRASRPDLPLGPSLGDSWDGEVERVGGRRRLRGEILLMVAAFIFVAGALLKPWPNQPLNRHSPRPSSSAAEIAAVPTPAATAGPTAVAYPDIQPGNFRGPFPVPADTAAPADAQAHGQFLTWPAVDWSAIALEDRHATWGFGAAVVSSGAPDPTSPGALAPTMSWATLGSPPVYSAIPVVMTQGVYAFAMTWPSDVRVSRISFMYLGGPEHPSYLPPSGFLPNMVVTPLPASSVLVSSPGKPSGQLRSGQFLVAPTSAAWSAVSRPLNTAWRANPWSWPYGAYQVTVTTATSTIRVVLELLLPG